jgi:hypothetical protein
MLPYRSSLIAGVCSLLLLSGCGFSSNGTSFGSSGNPSGAGGGGSNSGGGAPIGPIGGGGPAGSTDVIVATPSDSAVSVAVGAAQTVSITFTSSDGNAISGFAVSGTLATLPAGWSGPGSFSCASVSTGSGCVLNLTYAPTAGAIGTLAIDYVFVNNAGTPSTGGSVNIPYAATTNDNAVATVSPTGQINAVLGQGAQAVLVTFTTDDGRPATALQLTSSLSPGALPAGWSSTAGTFSCGSFSSGNSCQLALTYAPTSPGGGTLVLNYAYLNDAGEPLTGAVNIAYRATADNTVSGMPSQTPLAVVTGSATTITVTFTTDNGNPATNFSVTSSLSPSALPSGWSSTSPGGFTCPTVATTGTACQLSLTYAPTAPTPLASNTLSLTYGYNNNSGTAETGTVSISYAATQAYLYIAQLGGPNVSYCLLAADGTTTNCMATSASATFIAPSGIAFNGSGQAYVADEGANVVDVCNVMATGDLSSCVNSGVAFATPFNLAVSGSTLYVTSASNTGGLTICAIGSGGALSNCAESAAESAGMGATGIAVNSNYAYVGVGASTVDECAVGSMGSLISCTSTGSGFSGVGGISLANGYAYIANLAVGTVSVCSINADGTLSCGPASPVGMGTDPVDIAINGSYAYVDDLLSGVIYLCSVGAGGALTGCTVPTGSTTFSGPAQIAIH